MTKPRVFATFVPEAWINDYAVEIDGRYQFEITDQIKRLGQAASAAILDNRDASDRLWETWHAAHPEAPAHHGPFHVECEEAIRAFWES